MYTDNFYSGPTLFKYLKTKGFEACGTVDTSRRDFPPSLKPQKAELGKRNIERGEGRWVRDGDIVYVMWRDTKVVTIMSTMHHASGTETVVRKVKDKDGHLLRKEVSIPPAILDYNLNMGGVDLSDQAISYYNTLQKTQVLAHSLHFIDIMVINAFILYRAHLPEDEQSTITLKEFREKLVTQLCEVREELETHLSSPAQKEKEHLTSCNISQWKSVYIVTCANFSKNRGNAQGSGATNVT